MKIAIASTESRFDAKVDRHFGHCHTFIIYDSSNGAVSFIPNLYRSSQTKAGQNALMLLIENGVTKIVSCDFGVQIKQLTDRHHIQMIVLNNFDTTIETILQKLEKTYRK